MLAPVCGGEIAGWMGDIHFSRPYKTVMHTWSSKTSWTPSNSFSNLYVGTASQSIDRPWAVYRVVGWEDVVVQQARKSGSRGYFFRSLRRSLHWAWPGQAIILAPQLHRNGRKKGRAVEFSPGRELLKGFLGVLAPAGDGGAEVGGSADGHQGSRAGGSGAKHRGRAAEGGGAEERDGLHGGWLARANWPFLEALSTKVLGRRSGRGEMGSIFG